MTTLSGSNRTTDMNLGRISLYTTHVSIIPVVVLRTGNNDTLKSSTDSTNSVVKPEITRRGRRMSGRPHRHVVIRESPLVLMETHMLKAFQKEGKKENRRNQQLLSYYSVLCSSLYHKHGLV